MLNDSKLPYTLCFLGRVDWHSVRLLTQLLHASSGEALMHLARRNLHRSQLTAARLLSASGTLFLFVCLLTWADMM